MPVAHSRHVRFQEIAADMRRRILAGEVRPGERAGTYESLGKDYGAAIGTIRNAIGVLADEGLITTTQGVGIFVVDPLPSDGPPDDGRLARLEKRAEEQHQLLVGIKCEVQDHARLLARMRRRLEEAGITLADANQRDDQAMLGSSPWARCFTSTCAPASGTVLP